jgi:hypothetical protein
MVPSGESFKMRRAFSLALVMVMAGTLSPMPVAAQAPLFGSISGTAWGEGRPLANVTVQLRAVADGRLVGSGLSNAQGGFSFTGLNPGSFVVEIIGRERAMLGTSPAISLTPTAMVVSGVLVRAAVGQPEATAAEGGGGFFGSTLGLVMTTFSVIGLVAAGVAAAQDASPSQ